MIMFIAANGSASPCLQLIEIVLSWTELGRFTIIRTEFRFWNQTPTKRFGLARIEQGSTNPYIN